MKERKEKDDYRGWLLSPATMTFRIHVPLLARLGLEGGNRMFVATPRVAVQKAIDANGGHASLWVLDEHGWIRVNMSKARKAYSELQEEEELEAEINYYSGMAREAEAELANLRSGRKGGKRR